MLLYVIQLFYRCNETTQLKKVKFESARFDVPLNSEYQTKKRKKHLVTMCLSSYTYVFLTLRAYDTPKKRNEILNYYIKFLV